MLIWDRKSISFKTDLWANHTKWSKRDWQQYSVPQFISKILWRNADKTAQKMGIL